MFRTVTNIIMSCLLLVSTTGLAVSKHYCGDDLVAVEIAAEADSCCDDGACCQTETQHLHLDDDFVASNLPVDFRNLFSVDFFLNAKEQEIFSIRSDHHSKLLLYPDMHMQSPRKMQVRLAIHQVYRL
ncbi:MAG: HYC_CC_PP family protein [Bacteroidota bacterium]